jgi:methionine biosynthesis protein MetW
MSMRADLDIIQDWIPAGSRVLDLGCGDGELLAWLGEHKQVSGYGLEIDAEKIARCIERGVNVLEQDLDAGLGNFATDSFDVVVMTQSLQALRYPDKVLREMLRVGRTCIITFPNFGHWRCRWYLASKGRMPVSEFLPYTWYNTPNIHFCTFEDFERLCHALDAKVLERLAVDRDHRHSWASRRWPNLLGEIGIYRISSPSISDARLAV